MHVPLLAFVAALVAALGVLQTQSRMAGFMLSGTDSVIFAQLMHHILEGSGPLTTINPPNIEQHWFGFHFSPIIYLAAPFYAWFPSMLTLNILHSVVICSAAIPLYLLLERITHEPNIALAGGLLYLFNPFIINAAAWDFHEIAIAPLVMVGLLWAVFERRRVLFAVCCLLLICTKEHYGLAVAGAGVLWWRQHGDMGFGLSASVLGMLALVLIVTVIMPQYSPGQAPAMLSGDPSLDRYSWLRMPSLWPSVLPSLLLSNLSYALMLFGALLFAVVGRPWLLLPIVADLAAIMLSSNSIMRSVNSYHSAPIIPVMIIASFVYIYQTNRPWHKKWLRGSLCTTLLLAAIYLPYPISNHHDLWEVGQMRMQPEPEVVKHFEHIQTIIPESEALSVHTVLMPYFPASREIYSFPHRYDHVYWVVQRLDFDLKRRLQVASMPFNAHISEYIAATDALIADPQWQPIYAKDKLVVWHKGAGTHVALESGKKITAWRQEMIRSYCAVSHKNQVFEAPC